MACSRVEAEAASLEEKASPSTVAQPRNSREAAISRPSSRVRSRAVARIGAVGKASTPATSSGSAVRYPASASDGTLASPPRSSMKVQTTWPRPQARAAEPSSRQARCSDAVQARPKP